MTSVCIKIGLCISGVIEFHDWNDAFSKEFEESLKNYNHTKNEWIKIQKDVNNRKTFHENIK